MSEDAKDPFLSRWSRRKVAARRGEALPEPAAPAGVVPGEPPAAAAAEPAPELPSIDTLKGLESDYKAFMHPEIDPATRTAALKRLFGDPHFNTMDGLDVYIDDYSIPDPIPNAMLKTLSAARTLGLFEDDEKERAQGAAPPACDQAAAANLAAPEAPAATDLPSPGASESDPAAPSEKRDA
jgi:hypothetical protein